MTAAGRTLSQLSKEERRSLFGRLREHRERDGSEDGGQRIHRRPAGSGPAPLSFAQQRLWFLDRLQPGDPSYNVPLAVRLAGPLDREALARALEAVADRHETLRTTFSSAEEQPAQIVSPRLRMALPEVDLAPLGRAEAEASLARFHREEASRPFDLESGPLPRALLVRLGEEEHALLLTMHHIVSDGWSMAILLRETGALYSGAALPGLPIQYADFAVWQRRWLAGEVLQEQLGYWRERLAGMPAALGLPTDRPRPARWSGAGDGHRFRLAAETAERVRALAREAETTPFAVLLAAFQAVLHRWTGEVDLCVGTAVAGRNRAETAGLIGFFVNTLVLRGDLAGDPLFLSLVGQLRETVLGALAHQDLPFEKLVEELRPERDPSRMPLIQTMLVLQNAPAVPLGISGLELSPLELEGERPVQLDLALSLREEADGLAASIDYSSDLFDAATVRRLGEHFGTLLAGALAAPGRRLSELPMLSAAELEQVLGAWSGALFEPEPLCLHSLFEAQAARTPEAPAVEMAEHPARRLTYAELEAASNRLARHLRRLGVGPEVRAALTSDRTPELVVGMLAILKAGGAYLPLDPANPAERLGWMLEDAGAAVHLTGSELADSIWRRESPEPPDWPLPDPRNAAYVLYTSGSTGHPKGVVVEHRSAASYTLDAREAHGIRPGDRVLQFASIGFDVSVEEIFPALAGGACLVLRSEGMAGSAAHFFREVERLDLSFLDLPSGYWHELVLGLEADDLALPACLRKVAVGSEEVRADRLAAWRRRVGEAVPLLNLYGPTEATVTATRADLTAPAAEPVAERVPIGRPIRGTLTYVVDPSLVPVHPGAPGELLVGGVGLARGYLGRPELTAERFVPDPWSGQPGARLYRTGDRVRWRADGALEFLGRLDAQVKVRGFRIEPGEIEEALARHPGVAAAVVVPRAGVLAAYVVPGAADLTAEALRRFLAARLPAAMVPAHYVLLEALPLTPSGKVDRRRLPAPPRLTSPEPSSFVPPAAGAERELAAIWAEALGVERIGRDDNFFDLGGHSLLLPRVQAQVRERLGEELPLLVFFEHPTAGALAAYLERTGEAGDGGRAEESRGRVQRQRQGLELQRQRMAGRRGR